MGREDQVEEREVLDSIFPEEITGWAFTVFIRNCDLECTRPLIVN
jgi:hypothetical protein